MTPVIAAIATASGAAGIGVVRLSGDGAAAVADRVFRARGRGKTLAALPGYTALYGTVSDDDGAVDDCVALVFRAPHSYTGEDVVELSCHGGTYLLRRVLRAVCAAGAVPAGAGEFTKRAFLLGKMDLTEADAVMDLIAAEGRLSARMALGAHEGAVGRAVTACRDGLLGAAAQLAAVVDYPYEDIPELDGEALDARLREAEERLGTLLSTFEAGRILREGVDTVIVGCPNVGKSTLMNRLAGVERSIVTDVAGTTRDIVEERVRLGEVTLRLADTAGIRETEDTVEKIGVERARQRMRSAALCLCLFDGSRPLSAEDRALAEQAGREAVAVIGKADLPQRLDPRELQPRFAHVVRLSAATGEGLEQLEQAVAEVCGVAGLTGEEAVLSTERQRDGVVRARESVREAREALAAGLPDAAAVSVDAAVDALAVLTGERATEAVVNEVFSRFCVGK